MAGRDRGRNDKLDMLIEIGGDGVLHALMLKRGANLVNGRGRKQRKIAFTNHAAAVEVPARIRPPWCRCSANHTIEAISLTALNHPSGVAKAVNGDDASGLQHVKKAPTEGRQANLDLKVVCDNS